MDTKLIDPQSTPSDSPSPNKHVPGSTIANRYLLLDVIGVGGMGSVYRAKDLHFARVDRLVAIKELVIQTKDPEIRKTIAQNFEREANILAMLEHPAIPKIFDAFSEEDRSFLVMELVDGKDLEEMINNNPGYFPEERALDWAIQLCDVLSYLHQHQPTPIIFRDMKPSNVMVNQRGKVVLIDFGIAKPFQIGQKGTMIGTEGYSSPEQYRGDATVRTDIYSLGATLHHLLTKKDPRNEPPFSYNDRPVRKFNPAISAELEKVVQTAVQYETENRYANIEELRSALVAAGKKTGLLNRAHSGPRTADLGAHNAVTPLWSFKCEDEIRGSGVYADGSLYFGSYDHNVYALDAATGDFKWKYATHAGIVSKPTVLGDQIMFGSEDNNVYSVHAETGSMVWSYPTGSPIRSSGRVADDHLFIGSDDGFLHVIQIGSGTPAWTYDAGGQVRSSPYLLSDKVIFGTEAGELIALNFRGQTSWKFRAKRAITSSPVANENLTFVSSLDSYLYAIDTNSGWMIWRYRLEKASISSPLLVGNQIILGSTSGFVIAIDSKSGREMWRFKTDGQVNGSPSYYKDNLYIGSIDKHLYCLEIATGRLVWKYQTKGPITATPAVFDGMVYIGSTDHTFYAFGV